MILAKDMAGLPAYAAALLHEAIETSGSPIAVREAQALEFDSELQMAGPSRPLHLLIYAHPYRQHSLHFIVNAALKILRMYRPSPEHRLIAASDAGATLPPSEIDELARKLVGLSTVDHRAIADLLFHGTLRQLTSMPIDLRVEMELHELLPAHRSAQTAYLQRQVTDFEPTFMQEMAIVCSARIYAASTAMNVAFAETAATLAGIQPGPLCRKARHRDLGLTLLNHLGAPTPAGVAGDREVTDRWAQELGLRDWYQWTPLP